MFEDNKEINDNMDEIEEELELDELMNQADEDIQEERQLQKINSYPELSQSGHKLFDANGNEVLSNNERIEMINQLEAKYKEVLDILRISRNDPNSTLTPRRIAKMLVNELLGGRFKPAPKMTVFPNRKHVENLVISKGIEVMSMCSHHWQPISGECAIGYIPGDYVVGLSKLSRIVNWFSRRAQIQEELGEQIADYIENLIHPKALGVVIKAKHYCLIARGVKGSEDKSLMMTSVMRGYLSSDLKLRNEFLNLINK